MEIEQILKLVEAGFSKDEILKLQNVQQTQQAEPKEQSEPKEPAEPKEPSQPVFSGIDAVISKLDTLADSLNKLNIVNSQQPPQEGYEEMLAKIINPNFKGGN